MSGDDSTPYVGDFYDTLGVARDASSDEIKTAFRKLARQCHPDVAGDSPDVKARFTRVREAYETLVDPIKRATYDRRGRATYHAGPGRFGGKWRPPGGFDFEQAGDPTPGRRAGAARRRRDRGNDIGLEDIFGDFSGSGGSGGSGTDFGFGGSGGHQQSNVRINRGSYGGRAGSSGPLGGGDPTPQPDPTPGRDIHLKVDVPGSVAASGGTVTLQYPRLRRTEDGRGVVRYDEIHDLRVPPGTRHGDTLRVPRYGDAGRDGGVYGDLVCDVTVVQDRQSDPGPQRHRGRRTPHDGGEAAERADSAAPAGASQVDISVVEALLGGRVRVDTPAGAVHVTVPPCTSSGTRLRLRGRGEGGSDHFVELRIVTPARLDAESRALIERFAELNPEEPS